MHNQFMSSIGSVPIRIGTVRVSGNTRTHDDFILDEFKKLRNAETTQEVIDELADGIAVSFPHRLLFLSFDSADATFDDTTLRLVSSRNGSFQARLCRARRRPKQHGKRKRQHSSSGKELVAIKHWRVPYGALWREFGGWFLFSFSIEGSHNNDRIFFLTINKCHLHEERMLQSMSPLAPVLATVWTSLIELVSLVGVPSATKPREIHQQLSGRLRNVFGRGEALEGSVSYGDKSSYNFSVDFIKPKFASTRSQLAVGLFKELNNHTAFSSYEEASRGVNVRLSDPASVHTVGLMTAWRDVMPKGRVIVEKKGDKTESTTVPVSAR